MTGPVCVRHPGRTTAVRCTRCDRPACFDCLREASVGYHCVDCVTEGGRSRPRTSTVSWPKPTGRLLVVPALIAINVGIFMITVLQAASVDSSFFQRAARVRVRRSSGALGPVPPRRAHIPRPLRRAPLARRRRSGAAARHDLRTHQRVRLRVHAQPHRVAGGGRASGHVRCDLHPRPIPSQP